MVDPQSKETISLNRLTLFESEWITERLSAQAKNKEQESGAI